MELDLNRIIDQVVKDKGIKREVVIDTLEKAMLTAARRKFGAGARDRGAVQQRDRRGRALRVQDRRRRRARDRRARSRSRTRTATIPTPRSTTRSASRLDTAEFGRIAAQTAKQVIIQEVRGAERQNIYDEYKDRKGEIVHGIVRRIEKGNLIVDLGRAEAILPRKEQVPREMFRVNERMRAYVLDVLKESKGPQIILSRACTEFLQKLFEQEVPGDLRGHRAHRGRGARARRALEDRGRVEGHATSIRSARASACAAAACRPWCRSCAARRSTSSRGAATRCATWSRRSRRRRSCGSWSTTRSARWT